MKQATRYADSTLAAEVARCIPPITLRDGGAQWLNVGIRSRERSNRLKVARVYRPILHADLAPSRTRRPGVKSLRPRNKELCASTRSSTALFEVVATYGILGMSGALRSTYR